MRIPRFEIVDEVSAAILAAKTPAERITMVNEAHKMARLLAEAGARCLHPDWTEEQIRAEGSRRLLYGASTAAPPHPDGA